MSSMIWKHVNDYAHRCEPWTVCAISNGKGGFYFELWHDKRPTRIGGEFATDKAAKAEAQRIELAGQA